MAVWAQRSGTLALALALGLSTPGRAEETSQAELASLFQCAAGMGLFQAFSERPDSGVTEADKALLGQMAALEPRMRDRADNLARGLGEDIAAPIIEATKADISQRVSPFRGDPEGPRKVLDAYRPSLEVCIIRAKALPAPVSAADSAPQ